MFGLRRPKRELFEYWDGIKQRARDPLRLFRVLWQDEDLSEEVLNNLNDPESQEKLHRATSRVFELKEYDEETGQGLTESEVAEVLAKFFVYIAELKKKRGRTSTSQQNGEQTSGSGAGEKTEDTRSSSSSEPSCTETESSGEKAM